MTLKNALKERILIGDGAIGTLLYSYGIDQCFEQLNITHQEDVLNLHKKYLSAGADIIKTNTYGANEIKLARYGLSSEMVAINKAAVSIARLATKNNAYVVGTIGGILGLNKLAITKDEIINSFEKQLDALLQENVDGILLETYYDFDELMSVLKIARNKTELPIIANVSMHEPGILQSGITFQDALLTLEQLGADIVGANCRLGPHHMIKAFETVAIPATSFLSAYPNASLPDYQDGKLVYEAEADYFKKCALAFRNEGVRLLGGCCGTNPNHIRAFANSIKGLAPLTEKAVKKQITKERIVVQQRKEEQTSLYELAKQQRAVIVELDSPKHLQTDEYFAGVKALKNCGVDAITIADNSLASPRIDNTAIASLIKRDYDVQPLVHITCRDRNLIGLQSHIMGLHTLGLNEVLVITGDPTKIGDFPGATSVYDLTSFDLIRLMKQCNEGISFSGKSLQTKTNFKIAAAFNPNVNHLDRAVQRMERKIASGADYFITQPVYDKDKIVQVWEATKHLNVPIYLGVMPLTSARNAEFLHNEVPGIRLTDQVRAVMQRVSDNQEQATKEGLKIAKELIDVAKDLFNGIYLITPFLRYEMTVELTNYLKQ